MKQPWRNRGISIILMSCTFVAQAQTSPRALPPSSTTSSSDPTAVPPLRKNENWNNVRALVHDEEIIIWSSHNRHVRCLFTGATEDMLFCEPIAARAGEYRFNRIDVEKVRLEEGQRNFRRTVALTALAGVITGAAIPTSKNESAIRVAGAAVGGLAGMMAGIFIALPVALFVPGHLVYQRPRVPHPSKTSARALREHDIRTRSVPREVSR